MKLQTEKNRSGFSVPVALKVELPFVQFTVNAWADKMYTV